MTPDCRTFPAATTVYAGTQADDLSGPDQVKEGSSVIASMRYLGLGTLVGLNYDEASDLNLTYQNGGSGDAGDQYTGLDRFGRIVETIWIKGSSDVVQAVYGRNRASGIRWRRDDEASSTIAMDALYEYDGLQQVTAWKRGNLSPGSGPPYTGVTSKKQGEDFTYDQTGNWLGDVSDNPNFTQSRTHNKANQITSITGPSGVVQPAYDTVGNMTTSPSPGAWNTAYAYKWDAWNRLVEIKQGTTVVGAYAYDALTRRTRKTAGGVTRDIYYDRQWRSVEEREGSTVKVQHTWSPIGRWTLIRRKRNASGSTLNETLFCLRDYLDPVALANTSGNVVERYNYDAFGTVRIMNASYGVRGSSNYDWTFLYHGEFIDDESGLYNYGYRYYDHQLGRWISRDPIGEKGGVNLYQFSTNNPSSKSDTLGLFSFSGPGRKCCPTKVKLTSGKVTNAKHSQIFPLSNNDNVIQAIGIELDVEYSNFYPCCCTCCEMTYNIKWDEEYAASSEANVEYWKSENMEPLPLPHKGFKENPPLVPNAFYEDRSPSGSRQGDRNSKDSVSGYKDDCSYYGRDIVSAGKGFKGKLTFFISIQDTCRNITMKETSENVEVDFRG